MTSTTAQNAVPGPGARIRCGSPVRITKGQFKGRTGIPVLKTGAMWGVRFDVTEGSAAGSRTPMVSIHRTALRPITSEAQA